MKYLALLFFTIWMLSPSIQQTPTDEISLSPHNQQQIKFKRQTPQYDAQGRASSYNSKFAGTRNEEEQARFNFNRRRFYRRRRPNYFSDPCFRRRSTGGRGGRNEGSRESQGRFFWDLNVNNYYPQGPVGPWFGGPSYGGSSFGGPGLGAYSDDCAYSEEPVFGGGGGGGFGNFLALFSPGGALNPGGGRPPRPTPVVSGGDVDPAVNPQNPDDIFDPVYEDTPNRPYYDDQPRPPRPGQVVGGVANTVNNAIQTLSGYRPGRGIISEIAHEYSDLLFKP